MPEEPIPQLQDLQELDNMLAERVEQWKKQLLEEGMQKGMQKGKREGLATLLVRQLTLKFGPLSDEQREQIESADENTLLAWSEKILTATRLSEVIGD